jgi:hypothetical protein
MNAPASTLIGNGWLSWPRLERVGDRYGLVMLMEHGGIDKALDPIAEGTHGRLWAQVTARGLSGHIGDLFRGFAPPRSLAEVPAVGSRHLLGEGTLFYEDGSVGVRPDDGREVDWMDTETLYLLHEQEVDLTFEVAP